MSDLSLLEVVASEVELWRSQKQSRWERMPSELRRRVFALCDHYSAKEISSRLKLSTRFFGKGKKAVESVLKAPAFVKLKNLSPGDRKISCELEFPGGLKLRIY